MHDAQVIEDLVGEWNSLYHKEHAWTGENNPLEAKILAVAPGAHLDCMLYRGTGVDDGVPEALLAEDRSVLTPSKRLICSWTKDIEIARRFLVDAADTNFSAVLLAVHASRLEVVVDTTVFTSLAHDEAEVLVRNSPLDLTPEDVLEAWVYDEDVEECRQIFPPAPIPVP